MERPAPRPVLGPRTLPAHEWSQVRGQLGLAVLPAIETWLADSEAFERQARAAVAGRAGPAVRAQPATAHRPPRAPRQRTTDPSKKGFASV